LILGCGGYVEVSCEIGKEIVNVGFIQEGWMGEVVVLYEASDPVPVGFCSSLGEAASFAGMFHALVQIHGET
jgi:hypothetical protein